MRKVGIDLRWRQEVKWGKEAAHTFTGGNSTQASMEKIIDTCAFRRDVENAQLSCGKNWVQCLSILDEGIVERVLKLNYV